MTDHHDPAAGSSEDHQASALLRRATTDLTPDVDRLVAHGVARGRVQRRRRRVGASLAAVAVFGVVGTAAGVGSGLLDRGGDARGTVGFADQPSATPSPAPPSTGPVDAQPDRGDEPSSVPIDALVGVSAYDVPAMVADLLGEGELGPILTDPPYGVRDVNEDKVVHFLWDGTLTTFVIERADSLAGCEAQAESAAGYACVTEDGVQLLKGGPITADGVASQGVSAFVHGFVVTVMSYNAADGKDAPPVTDAPPISMDELTMLATSEAWFVE